MDVSSVNIYYVLLVGKDRLSLACVFMEVDVFRWFKMCAKMSVVAKVESGEFREKFKENKRSSSYSEKEIRLSWGRTLGTQG